MEIGSVNPLFWMMLFVSFWLGFFVIPGVLLKRALGQVTDSFTKSHSLCSETPKTMVELGLAPRSLTQRLFRPRDYRPYALQWLLRTGAVRETGDGKLCFEDEKLGKVLKQ